MQLKRIGDIGELAFMRRAVENGLVVCRPFVTTAPYDFVIEHNNKLSRVQVKTTGNPLPPNDRYKIKLKRGKGQSHRPYEHGETDFFAIYLQDVDVFYVIPSYILVGKISMSIFPHNPKCQFDMFKEGWEI